MAQFPPSPSSPFQGPALGFMLAWLDMHMNVDCDDSATGCNLAHNQLLIQSNALIQDRKYTLVLKKMPKFNWLQDFIVTAIDMPPISAGPIVVTYNFVLSSNGGFYSVISELTADGEYLIRMQITRC